MTPTRKPHPFQPIDSHESGPVSGPARPEEWANGVYALPATQQIWVYKTSKGNS